MSYPAASIIALSQYLLTDEEAGIWLQRNHFPELLMLADYLQCRNPRIFDTLLADGHKELCAFIDAWNGKAGAVNYLLRTGNAEWAAVANTANGDFNAEEWLNKTGNAHYARLADIAAQVWRQYDSD